MSKGNRVCINWFAVNMGDTAEETFVVKNVSDKVAHVCLLIKNSSDVSTKARLRIRHTKRLH